jgi:hypothetical protein
MSCIGATDAIDSCKLKMNPKQIKCVTDIKQFNTPLKKASYMLLKEPIQQSYLYDTIDTSQYCGGKTPMIVASKEDCPSYNTLCCTIPDAYNYHRKYQRFVPKTETLNVACEPGLCMSVMYDGEYLQPANVLPDQQSKAISRKMNKPCYNDTHCIVDTNGDQQVCVDPTYQYKYKTKYGWERKSVYEVQRKLKNANTWTNDPLYTNKSQHPYYINQKKIRQTAEAADEAAAAAPQKPKTVILEKKIEKLTNNNNNDFFKRFGDNLVTGNWGHLFG